jgi:NADPH:quinone reductase-like Zn-dependent oxidoreductase
VTLAYDVCGVVTKIGDKVTKFKVGDVVYGRVSTAHPNIGTCAEYTLATEDVLSFKVSTLAKVYHFYFKCICVSFCDGNSKNMGHLTF